MKTHSRCARCRLLFETGLQLVLTLVLLMSTGLFAMSGIDMVAKLSAQFAGGVRAPSQNGIVNQTITGFIVIFASILVVETSGLLISCSIILLQEASFLSSMLENIRALASDDKTLDLSKNVMIARGQSRAFDISISIAAYIILMCFFAALGFAGYMVATNGIDTDSGQALGNAGIDVFVRATARNTIMTTTLAAYICVFIAIAVRAVYALWQTLWWLFATYAEVARVKDTRAKSIYRVFALSMYMLIWPLVTTLLATAHVVLSGISDLLWCFRLQTCAIHVSLIQSDVVTCLEALPFPDWEDPPVFQDAASDLVEGTGLGAKNAASTAWFVLILVLRRLCWRRETSQWIHTTESLKRLSVGYVFLFLLVGLLPHLCLLVGKKHCLKPFDNAMLQAGAGVIGGVGALVRLLSGIHSCTRYVYRALNWY